MTKEAHYALRGIAHVMKASKDPAIVDYLKGISDRGNHLRAHAREVLVHSYRVLGERDKALTQARELARTYPDTKYGFFGEMAEVYHYYKADQTALAACDKQECTSENDCVKAIPETNTYCGTGLDDPCQTTLCSC